MIIRPEHIISIQPHHWIWLILYVALLVISLLCLSALYQRRGTHWLTRLAYAVMPVGAVVAVSGLLNSDQTAIDIGQIVVTFGMVLWSLRILRFLVQDEHNGKKRRVYTGKKA